MKYFSITLITMYLFFNSSCKNKSIDQTPNSKFEINICVIDKPLNTIINYSLKNRLFQITENCLICLDYIIENSENGRPADSLIFSQEIKTHELVEIKNRLGNITHLSNLQEVYSNNCIIDGLEFELQVINESSKSKTFIQNYYHPYVDQILKIINQLTPEKYGISYDADELLREYEDCEKYTTQELISEICDSVYNFSNQMPKFKDGNNSIIEYSMNELAPIINEHNELTGQLISKLQIELLISNHGKVLSVKIISKIDKSLKKKLREKLLTMTNWIPGKIGNQNVCMKTTIPISCFKWN